MEDASAMESAEGGLNEPFNDEAQFSASPRFASSRPTVRSQVDSLGVDLMALGWMIERGSSRIPDVALAVAHAALVLAETQPIDEDERFVRVDILTDILVVLERVGLGHFRPLVMAALDRVGDAMVVARGTSLRLSHRVME